MANTSAEEIDNLKKEAAAFREVRKNVGDDDGPRKVFDKVSCRVLGRLRRRGLAANPSGVQGGHQSIISDGRSMEQGGTSQAHCTGL